MSEPTDAEPEPSAEAPRGLQPPPGLAPAPGLRPPEVRVPRAFLESQAPQAMGSAAPPGSPEAPASTAPPAPAAPAVATVASSPEIPTGLAVASTPAASVAAARPGGAGESPGSPSWKPGRVAIGVSIGVFVLLILSIFLPSLGSLSASSSAPEPESTAPGDPGDIVKSFLEALAAGDGATARELAHAEDDAPLLTDAALAAALAAAPITAITIDDSRPSDDISDVTVTASYDIGGRRVSHEFTMWDRFDGWSLGGGTLNVYTAGYAGSGLRIGGVEAGDSLAVFPIGYAAEIDSPWIETPGNDGVVDFGSEDAVVDFMRGTLELTPAGVTEFRRLVRESLDSCLASAALTTPCGMNVDAAFSEGWTAVDGTVARTLSDDERARLDAVQPRTRFEPATLMTADGFFTAEISLDVQRGDEHARADLQYGEMSLRPEVDFSKSELSVVWE